MTKRVRTLLRVSSKMQLQDDDIPVQRAEVTDYIAKQENWVFDMEYIEKAVSAFKNDVQDREVLLTILEDARSHKFDVLLTYMSDRIGRREEYSTYVAALNEAGVEVWTIKDGQLKTEEHIDKLINFLRFWQNEGESKKTSVRVRDAQQERVKEGKFVGGKAPFGYKLVFSGEISNHGRALKKLEIVEEDAKIIEKIYSYAIHQGMGYERIANALNAEGIPAITTDKWKSSTIASILKNPIYMGYIAYNRRLHHKKEFNRQDRRDWIYSNEQNPDIVIISPQDWEKAQEIRESRKNRINNSKEQSRKLYENQHNYPVSTKGKLSLIGFCYCGYCGKKLTNGSYINRWVVKATGEEKVSYSGRYNCRSKCQPRSSYSQNYLEDLVFNVVGEYLQLLKDINVSEEFDKIHKEQERSVQKELKNINKEQKKLMEDIGTLEDTIPAAIRGDYCFTPEKISQLLKDKSNKLDELNHMEERVRKQMEENQINYNEMQEFVKEIPNWKEEFYAADTQTKQMILSTIIDRIEVKDTDIRIIFKIRLEDFLPQKTIDCGTIPYTPYLKKKT